MATIAYPSRLNRLRCWTADVTQAYLTSYTSDVIYITSDPEFGEQQDHIPVFRKTLYGSHIVHRNPINSSARKTNITESVTLDSELMAALIYMDQTISMRNLPRYLWVPIRERICMFGDNETVINTSSKPVVKSHNQRNLLPIRRGYALDLIAPMRKTRPHCPHGMTHLISLLMTIQNWVYEMLDPKNWGVTRSHRERLCLETKWNSWDFACPKCSNFNDMIGVRNRHPGSFVNLWNLKRPKCPNFNDLSSVMNRHL